MRAVPGNTWHIKNEKTKPFPQIYILMQDKGSIYTVFGDVCGVILINI